MPIKNKLNKRDNFPIKISDLIKQNCSIVSENYAEQVKRVYQMKS